MSMNTSTDWESLVLGALRNDRSSINALVRKITPRLKKICSNYAKTSADVEDLVQESLIQIFEKLYTLQEPNAFKRWASTVCARTCLAYERKRNPYLLLNDYALKDEDGELIDPYEDIASLDRQVMPADRAIYNESVYVLNGFIHSLPDEQQFVVTQFYLNQLSIGEIAEMCGVSESTIKSRLSYGRKKLRASAEEYQQRTGVKLFSVAPVFVLTFISYALDEYGLIRFSGTKLSTAALSRAVYKALRSNTAKGAAGGAGGKIASGATKVVATKTLTKGAAAIAAKGAFSGIGTKVAIGVVSAIAITGATTGAITIAKNNSAKSAPTVIQESSSASEEQEVIEEVLIEESVIEESVIEQSVESGEESVEDSSDLPETTMEDVDPEIPEEVLIAYDQILTQAKDSYRPSAYTFQPACYNFVYIDDDDIPELVVATGEAHADSAQLYTYKDGNVIDLGAYGGYSQFYYYKRSGLIASYFSNMGYYGLSVLSLNGGVVTKLHQYGFEFSNAEYSNYTIDGAAVSEEVFISSLEEYDLHLDPLDHTMDLYANWTKVGLGAPDSMPLLDWSLDAFESTPYHTARTSIDYFSINGTYRGTLVPVQEHVYGTHSESEICDFRLLPNNTIQLEGMFEDENGILSEDGIFYLKYDSLDQITFAIMKDGHIESAVYGSEAATRVEGYLIGGDAAYCYCNFHIQNGKLLDVMFYYYL